MRTVRLLALATVLLPLGSRTVGARVSVQGTVTATGGFTDNVLSTPEETPPGTDLLPAEADAFTSVQPSLALLVLRPRATHRLSYTLSADLFTNHSEANSLSHTLEWSGLFQTSRASELLTALTATQGQLNTFNLQAQPGAAQVGAQPDGGVTFLTLRAQEGLEVELTPKWIAAQSLVGSLFDPLESEIPQAANVEVDTHQGVERAWARDWLGPDLRLGYLASLAFTDAAGQRVEPQQELLLGLAARWRHRLAPFWATELDVGVLEDVQADDASQRIFEPTAGAAVRYLREEGSGELSYRHDVQPNLFIGQSFLSDEVALRAALPLGRRTGLGLQASFGFQHGRNLDLVAGATGDTLDVLLADASLSYAPARDLALAVRYQLIDQQADSEDFSTLTFTRNVVLLEVTGTYPPDPLAQATSRALARRARSGRAGGSGGTPALPGQAPISVGP